MVRTILELAPTVCRYNHNLSVLHHLHLAADDDSDESFEHYKDFFIKVPMFIDTLSRSTPSDKE